MTFGVGGRLSEVVTVMASAWISVVMSIVVAVLEGVDPPEVVSVLTETPVAVLEMKLSVLVVARV